MHPTVIGMLAGFALAFGAIFGGFGGFVAVAVLGLIGYLGGRVAEGRLDLIAYLGGGQSRASR